MMENKDFIDTGYDSAFDSKIFTWLPWVGKNYSSASKKLLIVAESNYEKEGEGIDKNRDFTREIVELFQTKDSPVYNRTFKNLDKLMGLNSNEKIKNFWKNVAYYDFVQRPMLMGTPTERPTKDDFHNGKATFSSILNILHPDFVLFIGVQAMDSIIKEDGLANINKFDAEGCRPREVLINGTGCKVIAVPHVAGRFYNKKENIDCLGKHLLKEFTGLEQVIQN